MCIVSTIMLILSLVATAIALNVFAWLLDFTVTAGLVVAVWLAIWLLKIFF